MARKVELVVNPASGSQLALSLVETHVRPLLVSSLPPGAAAADIRVWQTQSAGDAVRIGAEIAREHLATNSTQVDIVVVGGDGTTHELLNGLYPPSPTGDGTASRAGPLSVRLAIVPGGTANALYSALYPDEWTQDVQQSAATATSGADIPEAVLQVMLRSVHRLALSLKQSGDVGRDERLCELPLMLNTLATDDDEGVKEVVSHLVTSHALHAAILHDADTREMRAQYAGIERFKIAAQQNATRWTRGRMTLHALASGRVLRYAPRTQSFEPFPQAEGGSAVVEGPFLYLNAMVTDRLESAFVPAPLSSAFRVEGLPRDAVDVVAIRPQRDPQLAALEGEEEGVRFATTRLGEITTGMYSGGTHIDLTYDSGETMVEYFRCSGYTFTPHAGDCATHAENKARLVCTDGYISSADRVSVRRWTRGEGDHAKLAAPLVWR